MALTLTTTARHAKKAPSPAPSLRIIDWESAIPGRIAGSQDMLSVTREQRDQLIADDSSFATWIWVDFGPGHSFVGFGPYRHAPATDF